MARDVAENDGEFVVAQVALMRCGS